MSKNQQSTHHTTHLPVTSLINNCIKGHSNPYNHTNSEKERFKPEHTQSKRKNSLVWSCCCTEILCATDIGVGRWILLADDVLDCNEDVDEAIENDAIEWRGPFSTCAA